MAVVLVVEDDQSTQEFLQLVLNKDGHKVLSALNGEKGVELAESEEPDIILSDLMLPDPPSDLELLHRLREVAPQAPIVVISGYPSADRIKECEQMGITEFLTKPFEIPFVRKVVEDLASGNE